MSTRFPRLSLEELAASVDYGVTASARDLNVGPQFLRITDIQDDRVDWTTVPFCEASVAEEEAARLEEGDIVFARTGATTGKSFLIRTCPERAVFASYLIRVRPDRRQIEPRYLAWYFQTPDYWRQISSSASGTAQPGVNATKLKALSVPKPPLSEQRRIADILDKADAIRRKRKEAIALTEALLRSAFLEMFGDPVTNPKGWAVKPLGEVAEVNRGKFSPRPRNDPRFYGGTHPFIQTGELRNAVGYLRSWNQTLNEEGCHVSRGFGRGTIAIAIAANIGDTAIVDFDFYCPDSVVGIVARSERTRPEFLEMSLRFFQPKLLAEAPETAQKNINLETLRPLAMPLPGLELQERFSALYRRSYIAARKMNDALKASSELFNSLVARAFLGELTSATDENKPAARAS